MTEQRTVVGPATRKLANYTLTRKGLKEIIARSLEGAMVDKENDRNELAEQIASLGDTAAKPEDIITVSDADLRNMLQNALSPEKSGDEPSTPPIDKLYVKSVIAHVMDSTQTHAILYREEHPAEQDADLTLRMVQNIKSDGKSIKPSSGRKFP